MPVNTTITPVSSGSTLTPNKGYLQPTGFSVVINKGYFANLAYFAQSVQHPGATVDAVDMAVPQYAIPLAGDKITYSELDITLIIDEDMAGYKEMQAWLERTIQLENADPIFSDITLLILTSQNNGNVEIRYKDCIPTAISAIEFNSTSGDVTYLTFNATFRFTRFEIV